MIQPQQDRTIPEGEIITEPDGPLIPITVSSMEDDGTGPFREMPTRYPPSRDADPTKKMPTPMA
jgi:hypothetical protein